jgi:hypothetical protein
LPYKASGCRYHGFVVYFSALRRLEEEIMNGKYKSETQQNKALLNYAKKRK